MTKKIYSWLDNNKALVPAYRLGRSIGYRLNFQLQKSNHDFAVAGAPDGLPLPPPNLVFLVTGHYAVKPYYESGVADAAEIKSALAKNGYDLDNLTSILDFGVGCGRTVRQFKDLTGPKLFGCDYNPKLIDWDKANLPFASFAVNGLKEKLPYDDAKFDLIYAVSVFTHLSKELQDFWLEELKRVSLSGGLLYITLQGTTRAEVLNPDEKKKFDAGEMVTRYDGSEGSNVCGAYHPEKYIRDEWTKKGFAVIDFIPAGAKGSNQDVVLLKKM